MWEISYCNKKQDFGCPKVELYAKTSKWTDLQEKAKKKKKWNST